MSTRDETPAEQAFGTYALAQLLRALRMAQGATVSPISLPHSERELVKAFGAKRRKRGGPNPAATTTAGPADTGLPSPQRGGGAGSPKHKEAA